MERVRPFSCTANRTENGKLQAVGTASVAYSAVVNAMSGSRIVVSTVKAYDYFTGEQEGYNYNSRYTTQYDACLSGTVTRSMSDQSLVLLHTGSVDLTDFYNYTQYQLPH